MTAERLDWAELKARARGHWIETIFPALGITVPPSPTRHGPCPVCGGRDRFRCDDRGGEGTFYCNGCRQHSGDGLALVSRVKGCDFHSAVRLVADVLGCGNGAAPRRNLQPPTNDTAKYIWDSSTVDEGRVSTYLQSRALSGTVPETLRFHVGLRYWDTSGPERRLLGTFPAMVGEIVNVEGQGLGIHRTFLSPDGAGKADVFEVKKSGKYLDVKTISGGAIRVAAFEPGKPLVLAEGIETALAIHEAMGWPAWACVSASGLESVQLPEECREIVIGADLDANEAGQLAAEKCAARLRNEGRMVRIVLPPGPIPEGRKGVDWLDVLAEQGAEAVRAAFESRPANASTKTNSAAPAPSLSLDSSWPELDPLAVRGVLGELVRAIEPHSEADPAALLIQALAAFGNVLNRAPHFRAEADSHHMNLFAALVGETSKGRKGTSWGHIRRVFALIDPDWTGARVLAGLSSGEGLIWAVRDEIAKDEPVREKGRPTGEYQRVVVDRGIDDKRLLVLESEFASTLRVMSRDGNTLSPVIRQAWDSGDLRTMTKNSPAQATGAHISIVAHITKDELCRLIEANEFSNGFCNRFLWLCVRRSRPLPEGGQFDERTITPLIHQLQRAVQFGRSVGELTRDDATRGLWRDVYPELSEGKPGLLGAVISRAEAQTMRLASLYALQDMSYVVRPEHLTAALALWEYCEASAKYIFGQRLGDPIADELVTALRKHPDGMTKTEIRDWFGRNRKGGEIDRGLSLLARNGLARREDRQSGGRPSERWFAVSRVTT